MTRTTRTARALAAALTLTLAASAASAQQPMDKSMSRGPGRMNQAQMERMMSGWPKASQEATTFMPQWIDYKAPPAPYTERLTFATMRNTNDPDRPVTAAMGGGSGR